MELLHKTASGYLQVISDQQRLQEIARALRAQLETAFRLDTAADGTTCDVPSAGHCAIVSVIVRHVVGGQLVSAMVHGVSHWFNRVFVSDHWLDVDLTGDQFGFPAIQIRHAGQLYCRTRVRDADRLDVMTLCRARLLAERAGLRDPLSSILETLQARSKAPS